MRKTKIICTLGPASDSEEVIEQLILSGMDAARFNFSHGTHETHGALLTRFKRVRDSLGRPVATILDTKGPEIRILSFACGRVELQEGSLFTLTTREVEGDAQQVSVTYSNLHQELQSGCHVLIDDGLVDLEVEEIDGQDIRCRVVTGGPLSNHKSINIPGVSIALPALTDKDKEDLRFAVENDFDFVAASFVRRPSDVAEIRMVLDSFGGQDVGIIAKIENGEGVNNLAEIIEESDGIMVARGDLGVEIPFRKIPALQKVMINQCNEAGKIVVTATQMLESMTQNPRPTRAEVSDVANSIYDGTTAIMLSGESAAGAYPAEAVRTMAEIAQSTEESIDYNKYFVRDHLRMEHNTVNAVCASAYSAASFLNADAIVAVTRSGRTAKILSDFKPTCPVIAVTMEQRGLRQLKLAWGIKPVQAHEIDTPERLFNYALRKAQESGLVKKGSTLIVITSSDLEDNTMNDVMRVCKI